MFHTPAHKQETSVPLFVELLRNEDQMMFLQNQLQTPDVLRRQVLNAIQWNYLRAVR